MGSMAEIVGLDGPAEFFAPTSSDLVDSLIGQYRAMRADIDALHDAVTSKYAGALSYVLEGNRSQDRYPPSVDSLFCEKGKAMAVANLNAAYWSKALGMTDVLSVMPQKRRDEWNKSITEMKTPDFEEASVRATIQDLLLSRSRFFAERVDGIFRALSGTHVTNSPMGFGKRMILSYVLSYGSANHSQSGHINDLRCVIAKFMGRDEPRYSASSAVINAASRNPGQWMPVDAGALRIRVYNGVGTAHLEVHPDMAWRLNCVLAQLYPMAIPSEFRQKPKKKLKDFVMMGRPLPFAVIEFISEARRERNNNVFSFGYSCVSESKPARAEAGHVLEGIGGVLQKDGSYAFSYDPRPVMDEIITSGCIPDQVSHQYYPTPESVAIAAVELAEIEPQHRCLEPNAGQGGLADRMPKSTVCVEISALHCAILQAKGYQTTCEDFLKWSSVRFDRIVMNPPYSEGRWQAHITHAATMLLPGGRLVAILPASAKGKNVLAGFNLMWSREYSNEFAGTSVSVVILVAESSVA